MKYLYIGFTLSSAILLPVIGHTAECPADASFATAFESNEPVISKDHDEAFRVLKDIEYRAKKNPNGTANSGNSSANTVTDFSSLLSVSGLGGSLFGEKLTSDDDNIILNYNLNLGGDAGILNWNASLNRNPELHPSLLDTVPDENRDAFIKTFANQLNTTDDINYGLTYKLGIGQFSNSALSRMEGVLLDAISINSSESLQKSFSEISRIFEEYNGKNGININSPASDYPEEIRSALCNAILNYQSEARKLDQAENLSLKQVEFSNLISNQPQLFLSFNARERDPLIGPDEYSAKLTYEWGFRATLAKMQKNAKKCSDNNCRYSAYLEYVDSNSETIKSSDRLKLSIEYTEIDDYDFSNSLTGVELSSESKSSTTISFGYGRSINQGDLLANARLDIEIKYEDVDEDPDRHNRTIGLITLTNLVKGNDSLSIPFTLVYSNKSEYVRDNTDSRVSAHIGLKWKSLGL